MIRFCSNSHLELEKREHVANLVFIHGAGEDGRIWEKQAVHFGRAHKVLAVDLPGRGSRLDDPPLSNHEENAKDVLRQMDRGGIAKGVLVGHSMGGGVALTAALNHPERLSALVLVVTGARLKMHPDFLEKARQRTESTSATSEPPVPLEQTVSPSATAESLNWLRPRVMTAPPKTIYADFLANNSFDVMERLSTIALLTLVIGADEDRMAPPKFSQFMAEKISGAKITIFPKCGHYPQVEQEALFNQTLSDFVRDLG
jgi:pimeloyl-ACP methyl ester carboxylesterase